MERNIEEARLRVAASRMARQLVSIVEGVLYEWEVKDAEEEFLEVILMGLKEVCDDVQEKD